MKAKSAIPMLAVLVSAGAIMATGASASGGSTLVIRHQTQGCHAWSANGDAYKATQAIKLKRGAAAEHHEQRRDAAQARRDERPGRQDQPPEDRHGNGHEGDRSRRR